MLWCLGGPLVVGRARDVEPGGVLFDVLVRADGREGGVLADDCEWLWELGERSAADVGRYRGCAFTRWVLY